MVLDLLEISSIDAGTADLNLEPAALGRLARKVIEILDVTGGSPEMNPEFRWLVESARHFSRLCRWELRSYSF